MTRPAADRIEALLSRYLDCSLTPAERQDLEAVLRRDEQARRRFWEMGELHTLIQETVHRSAGRTVARRLTAPAPTRWRALAAAAAIVLGVAVMFSLLLSQAWDRHERLTRTPQYFATLIDARNAVFEASDVPTTVGSQLPGGFVRLGSGEVDVEFFSGARVTVTGPAVFGINSAMRGFLRRGHVLAHCPPQAKGFTIGGPGVAVIDLGTRFSMTVDAEGGADVRVLEGQVAIAHDGDSRIVNAGQHATVKRQSVSVVDVPPPAPLIFTDDFERGEHVELPTGAVEGQSGAIAPAGWYTQVSGDGSGDLSVRHGQLVITAVPRQGNVEVNAVLARRWEAAGRRTVIAYEVDGATHDFKLDGIRPALNPAAEVMLGARMSETNLQVFANGELVASRDLPRRARVIRWQLDETSAAGGLATLTIDGRTILADVPYRADDAGRMLALAAVGYPTSGPATVRIAHVRITSSDLPTSGEASSPSKSPGNGVRVLQGD